MKVGASSTESLLGNTLSEIFILQAVVMPHTIVIF